MKRIAIAVGTYVVAIVAGAILAGVASVPFLRPGDFSIQFQMIIMAVMSGFYILAFTPVVIAAEVLVRNTKAHPAIPLFSIPIFGTVFPVLGFVLFPERWWPEEPIDMKMEHVLVVSILALLSIGIGLLVTTSRNKKANKMLR